MKKKISAVVLCVSMFFLMCACSGTTPVKSDMPTPQGSDRTRPRVTETPETPVPTVEGGDDTENVPITDYEEYVDATGLAKDYVGILVEKVTDEELENYIQGILEQNKKLEERDRAIQNGDNANIDFTGYLDGTPFDGGSDTGFDLEIGSGSFIEGFEEGLIGAKKGETRSLELSFPEGYKPNPDLAGKDVVFEVKINSVSEYVLPELTDDFVNDLTYGESATVQEFRDSCMKYLTEEKQYFTVIDYLVENTEFTALNEAYIQANLESMKSYYEMYAGMYNVDLETFMLMAGVEDSEAFWTEMENEMRRQEKERIVLYCVAKAEGITLTEEKFTQYASELAESYQMTLEEFLADNERKYIEQSLLMECALEFLLENVVEK